MRTRNLFLAKAEVAPVRTANEQKWKAKRNDFKDEPSKAKVQGASARVPQTTHGEKAVEVLR